MQKLISEESLQVFKEGRIVEYIVEEEEKIFILGEVLFLCFDVLFY